MFQIRIWLFSLLLALAALPEAAQAQYLQATGLPTFAAADSVPMGVVNVANGNLHIEIPIVELPQRGGVPFQARLVYDSRIWKIVDNGSSQSWQPTNVQGTQLGIPEKQMGWRFLTTGSGTAEYDTIVNQCSSGGQTYYWQQYQNYRFGDLSGTVRRFPLYKESSNVCHSAGTETVSGPALDATGMQMNRGATQLPASVIAPDGSSVYLAISGSTVIVKDANGNYMNRDASGTITDTLNRTAWQKTYEQTVGATKEIRYAVPTSQGTSTYKFFFTSAVSLNTNFGVPGVTEYSASNLQALTRIDLPDGSSYHFTYDDGIPYNYGLLKSMTLPTGEVVNFTHANFTDAQGNKQRWLSTVSAGGGTRTYTPSTCGTNCNRVKIIRPSGDETLHTFTLNNGAWNTETRVYKGTETSGTLELTVSRDYDTTLTDPVSGGAAFIRPIRTTTTLPGPAGNLVQKVEDTFDTYTYNYRGANYTGSRGNNLTHSEYAFGSGAAGGLLRQQVMSYLHDSNSSYTAKNIVNRVTNAQTKDGAGVKISERIALYDSTSLISASGITHHDASGFGTSYTLRGNVTQVKAWTGSGSSTDCPNLNYLCTTYNYDITGQPRSTVDPKGNTAQMSYANSFYLDNGGNPPASYSPAPPATNAFITQLTLPVSGSISMGYYYGSGNRAFATDQNSRTSYFHFQDSLDRPTKIVRPGGLSVQNTFDGATHIVHSAGAFQDEHFRNTMGRPTTGTLNSDPQGAVSATTTYDSSGRVQSVTNPFRGSPNGSVSMLFDGLDRTTRITMPDSNYQEAFFGSAVASGGGRSTQLCSTGTYGTGYPSFYKDEAGKKRQRWTDALGRLIEADEPDAAGAMTLATCYKYDVLGNLIQVDQGSQARAFVHDALSRLISTPEGGTENFFYVTSGGALCSGRAKGLCRSTDPRGITTTYSYDAENRLSGKTYSSGEPAVSYFYDQTSYNGLTITNGKGRRTGMSDGSGQTAWTYDSDGNVLTERRSIAGITKNISYTYHPSGSVNRITYPSGLIVQHTYSTAGRLAGLACLNTYCSGTWFASAATYEPSGALASLLLGQSGGFAGIANTYSYNNRMQPASVLASHSSGSVILLNLTFSFVQAGGKNNGAVASITNVLSTGRTQTFTYDELNRIQTAQTQANSGGDCWGQSFNYDRYGNLGSIAVTKCAAPTLSLAINSSNQITNSGFSYDLGGNLAADSFNTYTWTAEDQLAATAGVTYTYDGDGRRVKKSNGKLYWHGVGGEVLAESDLAGAIASEYIYFQGRRVARRDPGSGSTYYFITDHLGSARVATNSAGAIVESSDYYPYGGERILTDSLDNNYKFAGLERDPESALDHTLYRQYSASLARWLSPDTEPGTPANPQSWNRYAYVLDNPLTLIDPLGDTPDPYSDFIVACMPSFDLIMGFGCGWEEDSPCPPGYVPIHGSVGTGSGGAPLPIETVSSALEYAGHVLEPWAQMGILTYGVGPEGLWVRLPGTVFDALMAAGPGIAVAWPIIVEGATVLIHVLRIATIYVLSKSLSSIVRECKLVGGQIPDPQPGPDATLVCLYECEGVAGPIPRKFRREHLTTWECPTRVWIAVTVIR